jgi:dienelactone hydrolase
VIGNRTNPRATIVMYSDIFGLTLPNNKIIADAYAKSGEYLVYLPDFFEGDPAALKIADVLIPADTSKQSTFAKYSGMLMGLPSFLVWQSRHGFAKTDKTCMDWLAKLRQDTPKGRKIGMVGFCWGGRYAIRAGLKQKMIEVGGQKVPLVDAVVALHPSNMVLPADVEEPVVPISIGWGVEDIAVSYKNKAKVEEIHAKEAAGGFKVPEMEHKSYTPGRHGFGVRGNPDDPAERACLEGTEKQVLDWFKRWL